MTSNTETETKICGVCGLVVDHWITVREGAGSNPARDILCDSGFFPPKATCTPNRDGYPAL